MWGMLKDQGYSSSYYFDDDLEEALRMQCLQLHQQDCDVQ